MATSLAHRASRSTVGGVVVAAAALLIAACGSGGSSAKSTTTTAGATPTTTASSAPAGSTSTTLEPIITIAPKPTHGGVLHVRVESEVAQPWTPANMQCDPACYVRALTFFEPLMAIDKTDNKPKPYLAQSLAHSADYKTWTMKLRSGINFSDGTPLNADAVIDNSTRVKKSFLLGAAVKDIVAINKIDNLTVQWVMSRPWITFDYALTTQGAFAASPTWLAAADKNPTVAAKPVGTGPFILTSFVPGQQTIVKRNPNYWRKDEGLPYLDEIDFRVVPDELQAANAMKTGEIQIMATDNGQNIKNFKDNKSFNYEAQDKFNDTFYVLMNVGQQGSPLADQNVRCGLAAATDVKTLASVIGQDQFPIANGLFSPSQQGYLANTGNQQYDVAKAKQLIKTWSDAHGGQKPKIIYTTTTDSTALQAAQLLQQWWDEAGADVQVLQLEQSKLITNALLGDPQFMAFGWRNHAGYVVDNQYFWWHSSQALPPGQLAINFGRLRDPVIDQMLDDAHTNPDLAKETADAQAINREFAKQCWVIPEMWVVWGIVSAPKVQGLDGSTFPGGTGQLGSLGGVYWLDGAWLKS